MTAILFKKDVKIKGVTTLGHQLAHALSDPVRIQILDTLSHKEMTTEDIAKILRRSHHKKATTTIRHHLDILKVTGLIEVTRMVQVRGAVKKYYMSTMRAFNYNLPDLDNYSKLIEDTSSRLLKVVKAVFEDARFESEMTGKMFCNLCKGDHYKEYVAIELLNNAMARMIQSKEYTEMVYPKTKK
jgi:DNA-binding transcriptional ArsR family regulator